MAGKTETNIVFPSGWLIHKCEVREVGCSCKRFLNFKGGEGERGWSFSEGCLCTKVINSRQEGEEIFFSNIWLVNK